jgi:hypothetical protein
LTRLEAASPNAQHKAAKRDVDAGWAGREETQAALPTDPLQKFGQKKFRTEARILV